MSCFFFWDLSVSVRNLWKICASRGRGAAVATLLAARAKLEKQDAQGAKSTQWRGHTKDTIVQETWLVWKRMKWAEKSHLVTFQYTGWLDRVAWTTI